MFNKCTEESPIRESCKGNWRTYLDNDDGENDIGDWKIDNTIKATCRMKPYCSLFFYTLGSITGLRYLSYFLHRDDI